MQIKSRIARLEGPHISRGESGPVIVHFVSPIEGEDCGKGHATFPGTGIPKISRQNGETREVFTARAQEIWVNRDAE